jgi:rfaE bifunctional protein kinase chain/domain
MNYWYSHHSILHTAIKTLFLLILKLLSVSGQTIQELLEQFSKLKVLIIGDVMVDSYLWGHVSRISPEAPVPVVTQSKSEYRMGGAANVARNIKALGAKPVLCSVIGKDSNGELFLSLLSDEGLTEEGILRSNSRITTVKTRIIAGSQHLLRVDHEMDDYIDMQQELLLFSKVESMITEFNIDAIIFQDYDKGVITPFLIEKITTLATIKNIPTLVDPKKRNFTHYRNTTLFKPNFKELVEGLNIQVDKKDFDSVFNSAKLLHENASIKLVMITLSELGIMISDNRSYHVIPAEIRDIADVSGAGDTVIGMAALCLASGLSPRQTAALANLAGGIVCEKVGVVPIEKELLMKENFTLPVD